MPIPTYKTKRCRCGCKEQFEARYIWKGGIGYYPDYKRGHHPHCRKNQTGRRPPWNKGKKKGDHPSLVRMGFQHGNKHWNWQEDQNPDWFSPDFDHVALARKFGHRRRTRFVSKLWGKFRDAILDRDGHECQRCGYPHGRKITDPTMLHVHHKKAVRDYPDLIFDDENAVTLCRPCHWRQHRGHKKRKRLPI